MEGVAAVGENVCLAMSEVGISMGAAWGHAAFAGGVLIAGDAGPKMHPVDILWLVKN